MQKDTGGVIGPQVDKDKGKFNAYVVNFRHDKKLSTNTLPRYEKCHINHVYSTEDKIKMILM